MTPFESACAAFLAEEAGQLDLPLLRRRPPRRPRPPFAATKAPSSCGKAMLGTGLPCVLSVGHASRCDTISDWPPR